MNKHKAVSINITIHIRAICTLPSLCPPWSSSVYKCSTTSSPHPSSHLFSTSSLLFVPFSQVTVFSFPLHPFLFCPGWRAARGGIVSPPFAIGSLQYLIKSAFVWRELCTRVWLGDKDGSPTYVFLHTLKQSVFLRIERWFKDFSSLSGFFYFTFWIHFQLQPHETVIKRCITQPTHSCEGFYSPMHGATISFQWFCLVCMCDEVYMYHGPGSRWSRRTTEQHTSSSRLNTKKKSPFSSSASSALYSFRHFKKNLFVSLLGACCSLA